jgi:large subunit ribosomal protein L16
MLIPKKVKFRKWQTGRSNPKTRTADTRGIKLAFGSFGLKSESQARVRSTQIESARKVISRTLTKTGKYWVRIFPDRPYTAKAAEVGRIPHPHEYLLMRCIQNTLSFRLEFITNMVTRRL